MSRHGGRGMVWNCRKMKYYTLEEFMRMWVRKYLKFNYKYNYLYK